MTPQLRLLAGFSFAGASASALSVQVPTASSHAICHAANVDTGLARQLVDSIERSRGRAPSALGYVGLETATRAVSYHGRCYTAVTLTHDAELGGGIVVVESARPTDIVDVAEYPGAREPIAVGQGRIGFTFTSLRGSGLYESRLVVLCALAANAWDNCLDITRDKETTVYGASAPLVVMQTAAIAVTGDTVIIRRRVEYRRSERLLHRATLAASRLVLPSVP